MFGNPLSENLPTPREIGRTVALIVSLSLLTGAFLFHVWVGLDQVRDRWPTLLTNVYYSFIYATVMIVSLKGTIGWLQRHVSVRTRASVVLHVGLLSLVAVASYTLATGICWVLHPNFSVAWEVLVVTATIAFLVTLIWSSFAYLRRFYQEVRAAEAAKYEARLDALRAQINPHFLFNAFNSIAALIRTRPEEAETVVEDLADLFRYTLHASKNDVSTLREEIEAAQQYLAVERARFRDRLHVEVDVPDSLRGVSIPAMILQPLVENAVKHGVAQTRDDCTVRIVSRRRDGHLILSVADTGPGFDTTDPDDVLDEGTGLANVRERLRLFYDGAADLTLHLQGVEVRLPLDRDPADSPQSEERAVSSKR